VNGHWERLLVIVRELDLVKGAGAYIEELLPDTSRRRSRLHGRLHAGHLVVHGRGVEVEGLAVWLLLLLEVGVLEHAGNLVYGGARQVDGRLANELLLLLQIAALAAIN